MAGIKVKVGADASQFERTMKGVKGRLSSLNVMVAGLVAFKALGASIRAAGDAMRGFMDLVKEGEQAKTEEARLRNVVRQMGLYGNSADKVADRLLAMADATELMTGVDAASITMTQSKLATFADLAKTAGVVGGAFDRATRAAIDLAATGFGSAESNAVMLGKALSDPERGLTALRRTGTLTTDQIDKIKAAFEQSGDRAEYMGNVLSAVERQVKGTAAATANGSERMSRAFEQLREEVGKPLSDQFDRLAQGLIDQIPRLKEAAASIGNAVSNTIADLIQGDTAKLMAIGEFIGTVIGKGFNVGFKATMRGIGTKVFQAFDMGENAIRNATGLNRLMGQADLGERASSANAAVTGFESRVAMREMQRQFASMMAELSYDANFRRVDPSGQVFRQAAPGESTPIRDETGRRLIEVMSKVEQNTRGTTFPTR
jgi:Sec-independent protein translocase protein TatA